MTPPINNCELLLTYLSCLRNFRAFLAIGNVKLIQALDLKRRELHEMILREAKKTREDEEFAFLLAEWCETALGYDQKLIGEIEKFY